MTSIIYAHSGVKKNNRYVRQEFSIGENKFFLSADKTKNRHYQ